MQIPLYRGGEHVCSYLPDRRASMAVVSPDVALNPQLYAALLEQGFRRSGDRVYRPHCSHCSACVPVRIPVRWFRANRSQRRVEKRNSDLAVVVRPAAFNEDQYQLFVRYLEVRHSGGEMEHSDREDFLRFLGNAGWLDTQFCEFRDAAGTLLAVSVIDVTPQALSAVYTYYDPDFEYRSLGTWAVLWQIAEAQRRGLEWVYLGFWIADCRKMSYKRAFQPLECLTVDGWRVRSDEA